MATFASRKILLVDDDDDLRRAYAAHLTAHGFVVEEADDAAGARRASIQTLRFSISACPMAPLLSSLPASKKLNPRFR
jgi:DNA-binding response OmpR family regulator